MTETPYNSTIHGAVRHPEIPAILTVRRADAWQLPTIKGENIWLSSMHRINPGFSEILDSPVWGLRQIYHVSDNKARTIEAIIELEIQEMNWQDDYAYRWVRHDQLEQTAIPLHLQEALMRYLRERMDAPDHPLRPPWSKPGWRTKVYDWIEAKALQQGWTLKELLPVKQWGISCVMRARTSGQDLYIKTTNINMPLFVNEALATDTLASLFPDYLVRPFAIRPRKDWMLLYPFTKTIGEIPSDDPLPAMFRRYAQLQIESISQVAVLQQNSVLDRRIPVLQEQLKKLFQDPEASRQLSDDTRDELMKMLPVFVELLDKLNRFGIPETLVHGDLHAGNAAYFEERIIFFDWTDACISHPFFDLQFLQWLDEKTGSLVLEAYLEPWQQLLPQKQLRAAVRLARALLPLHYAVSYQYIVANLEPASKSELDFTHLILKDALAFTKGYLKGQ